MPHSRNDNAITQNRPEEDTIEPCSASNEPRHSNQPRQAQATPAFETSNQHPVPFGESEQNATSHKTLFGLKEAKKQSAPTHINRFDYEQKYPRDPFGQERAENARVWLTYLDEAESFDRDKIDGWKDTVDVLLVFAGLFSGVVSTFLSQASQSLQQDFTQVSASLLYEMVQLQRAQLTGASIANVAKSTLTPNTSFTPSINASLVNGLWYSSLTTSLCTALFAVLTKQWLYYYQSPVPGTARDKVIARQFRFEGLEKWKVALIVDLLPVLLHLSLGLFLIGLVVFILPLDIQIVWIIIILSGLTYILYFMSIILPIRYPQCPYATPLTIYIGFIIQSLRFIYPRLPNFGHIYLRRLSLYRDKHFSELPLRGFRHSLHFVSSTISKITTQVWNFLKTKFTASSILPSSKNWRETQLRKTITGAAPTLEDNALYWLSSTSSNPAVSRIIARTIFKSPNFDKQPHLYDALALRLRHNSELDDKLDENSMRLHLRNSEFFEDLYHSIHLTVLDGGLDARVPRVVSTIQKGSASFQKEIKEGYLELFSIITVLRQDHATVLLMGLRDNSFKLREDIWVCLLQKAREDKELASQIIRSNTFDLFDWDDPPSSRIHCEAIPLANRQRTLPPRLKRASFSYLLRYFFQKGFPDDGSFESRYLLFIIIYHNLISDDPLIVNPMHREKVLKHLLSSFSCLPSIESRHIQNQVTNATFVNKLQRDLLLHNSVFNNMSLDIQGATIDCFERFGDYHMNKTGDFSIFFITLKEELQFMYRWCSKAKHSGELTVQRLFMPGNLSNLCTLLIEDRDHAISNFGNCLKLLLRSSESCTSGKHMTLYEEHIIPNVVHLFTATILADDSDPLFSILYDPSVVAKAWQLLVAYPSALELAIRPGSNITIPSLITDRSRAVLALLPSRFDSDCNRLKKIHDLMIKCMDDMSLGGSIVGALWYLNSEGVRRACISAYIFGRMAGLIVDPNTFNLPSSIIDKGGFKDATDMRNELERQFMEEKRKQSRSSLFNFSRITRNVQMLWRKESDAEETELEAV